MATNIGKDKKDDIILGKSFKDKLFGLGGDDRLSGRDGHDELTGGKGDDKLTGGSGKDTFIFGKGQGKDIITDFEVGKDVIEIKKGVNGIDSAKEALKKATQLKNGDVEIDLGKGNKIILKDVKLNKLTKDDFDIT